MVEGQLDVLVLDEDIVDFGNLYASAVAKCHRIDGVFGQIAEFIGVASIHEQALRLTRVPVGQFHTHVLVLRQRSLIGRSHKVELEVNEILIHRQDGVIFPSIGNLIEGYGFGRHANHHVEVFVKDSLFEFFLVFTCCFIYYNIPPIFIVYVLHFSVHFWWGDGKAGECLHFCSLKAPKSKFLNRGG